MKNTLNMADADLVRVNLYASARAAIHKDSLQLPPATLTDILESLAALSDDLKRVLPQCSYLHNGIVVSDFSKFVEGGSNIDVLPKFAGGCF